MAALTEMTRLGDLVYWEEDARFSRENVVVASGSTLAIGTVVGKVTATGKVVQINFSGNDGSQNAYGVVIDDYDATNGDVRGVAIVREAVVNDSKLVWPSGATAEQKANALAQLAAKGVITRPAA